MEWWWIEVLELESEVALGLGAGFVRSKEVRGSRVWFFVEAVLVRWRAETPLRRRICWVMKRVSRMVREQVAWMDEADFAGDVQRECRESATLSKASEKRLMSFSRSGRRVAVAA